MNASWPVSNAAPGPYTASVAVRDANGKLLGFSSLGFEVESSADTGAGLSGQLVVTPTLVGAGAPLVTSWNVEHVGNADFEGLVVRVDLVALADESVVDFADTVLDLPRGASRQGGSVFDSLALVSGSYLAVLTAIVPAGEVQLDAKAFTVERGVSVDDTTVVEGDSGTRMARFRLRLSSTAEDDVSVRYATRDSSALAGLDFITTEGEIVFAPGESEKELAVPILGDVEVEVDEVFLVVLTEPLGVVLGDAYGVGTILDEEGCASPNLLINPGAEDDPELLGWTPTDGVHRGFGDPEPLTGTAYFVLAAGTTLTQDVSITAFAGSVDAGTQSFAFDAFVRPFDAGSPAGEEIGVLTVEMLDAAGLVLDAYEASGTPDVEGWQMLGGMRSVPAGTRTLRVIARNDSTVGSVVAFDRTAVHSLAERTLQVHHVVALEGDSAGSASLRLTLACPGAGDVAVDFATIAGTATDGLDFVGRSGTLTFAAGEVEATLSIDLVGDLIDEDDESFSVVLSAAVGAVVLDPLATVTILDDDGEVAISAGDVAVMEGDDGTTPAVFAVTLSGPSGRTVAVDFATSAMSATSGVDFAAESPVVADGGGGPRRWSRTTFDGPVSRSLALWYPGSNMTRRAFD
jgi:hypothetical protein